eukprot:scaffold6853_cov90-Isochrysis_galbana.AAC.2
MAVGGAAEVRGGAGCRPPPCVAAGRLAAGGGAGLTWPQGQTWPLDPWAPPSRRGPPAASFARVTSPAARHAPSTTDPDHPPRSPAPAAAPSPHRPWGSHATHERKRGTRAAHRLPARQPGEHGRKGGGSSRAPGHCPGRRRAARGRNGGWVVARQSRRVPGGASTHPAAATARA